jgi:hypothetical protein
MALDYDLDLGTTTPAVQVARELREVAVAAGLLGSSVSPELILEEGVTTSHGTWVRVIDANPRPWDAVITDLGFTPTVTVGFRLGRTAFASQDEMVQLTSGLLERVPGDAVLHFQYEDIWLLRRDGELSLNERDDLWPPRRLATVRQPCRRATHTFSDE